jgi:metal-responsive CopG/Arc/MetJ family transcriptional regulator
MSRPPPAPVAPRPPGRPRAVDPMMALTIRLPQSLMAALDGVLELRQRGEPGMTKQDLIRDAIARYIAPPRRKTGAQAGRRRAPM